MSLTYGGFLRLRPQSVTAAFFLLRRAVRSSLQLRARQLIEDRAFTEGGFYVNMLIYTLSVGTQAENLVHALFCKNTFSPHS